MKGYLYQIKDFGDEWLFWSLSKGQEDYLRDRFIEFKETDIENDDFEYWFNNNSQECIFFLLFCNRYCYYFPFIYFYYSKYNHH